jgi:saccharopine dehydrogenase-like NADP-dependent oxidoreductase
MKNILVLGAGRSASSLIRYLLDNSTAQGWEVTVADISIEMAEKKTSKHKNSRAIGFDIANESERQKEMNVADIIISLLPPHLHHIAALECIRLKKNLVTASYVSSEIKALDKASKEAGIILLNETGLDPGLDHMSAMHIIDRIKKGGGEITGFRSFCGGLVAPESNDNPWGYKFTWNPRNVVMAGQGTAQLIEDKQYKYIPYNRLFIQTELISIAGYGSFEAYANRDSLSYRKHYDLENIPTIIRGTLRMPGFCKAWNAFVQLGWTDDSYSINASNKLTYCQLLEAYLPKGNQAVRQKLADFLREKPDSEVMNKLEWLGIFEDNKIGLKDATPVQILQDLLERKWKLGEKDIDMIVMQHIFDFRQEGKNKRIISSLVVKGEDQVYTAMAKTVGLPLGIAAKLILNNKISSKGVRIPVMKEIYEPVLQELINYGISFKEEEKTGLF